MSDIVPFSYEDFTVRTVLVDGEPWFVAADVAKAIHHSNMTKMTEMLDDDEKGLTSGYTPGGQQQMVIINEPGLYRILMRSDKTEARKFQRWVTHDVLPQIRKTGSYELVQTENTPAGWLPTGQHLSSYDALEIMQRSAERTTRMFGVLQEYLSDSTKREVAEYLIRVPVGLTKAHAELDRKITGSENVIGLRSYLDSKGVPKTQIKRWVASFGVRVHAVYKEEYGREASFQQKALGAAGRAGRMYVEKDRFILDAVFDEFVGLGRFTPR